MVRSLNILLVSIIIAVLHSCCHFKESPKEEDGPRPEWDVRLPVGTAKAIMNFGISPALVYDDVIVFHTTLRNLPEKEDNRLVGVNTVTHTVDWIFPKDTTINDGLAFFANAGCIDGDHAIIKSAKDMLLGSSDSERVICFSLKNQEVIWSHVWPGDIYGNPLESDIHSCGDKCYATINGWEMYSFDKKTGEKELVFDSNGYDINHGPLIIDQDHFGIIMTRFCDDRSKDDARYVVINPNTGEELVNVQIPYDEYFRGTVVTAILSDGVIYYTDSAHAAAIDALTGEVKWSRVDEGYQCQEGMHLSGNILLKLANQCCMAFDISDGHVVYSSTKVESSCAQSCVYEDRLYDITPSGDLEIRDFRTGELLKTITYPKDKSNIDYYFGGDFGPAVPCIYKRKLYLMGQSEYNPSNYRIFCYSLDSLF